LPTSSIACASWNRAGKLAEPSDERWVTTLSSEIGHERQGEVTLADLIENIGRVQDFVRVGVHWLRRRT